MNAHVAAAIINVALIALIGFAIFFTHSLWPLVGLVFLMYSSTKSGHDEDGDDEE